MTALQKLSWVLLLLLLLLDRSVDVRDRQTDRQTRVMHHFIMPPRRGHNNEQ